MTPETVRAAKWAEERGAAVAAVTLKAEGDLAKAVRTAFIGKSIVAGYAAFSKQCGLYLAPSAIAAHAADIAAAGLKATKTGVTFSQSKPMPDARVRKLALASRSDQNL